MVRVVDEHHTENKHQKIILSHEFRTVIFIIITAKNTIITNKLELKINVKFN